MSLFEVIEAAARSVGSEIVRDRVGIPDAARYFDAKLISEMRSQLPDRVVGDLVGCSRRQVIRRAKYAPSSYVSIRERLQEKIVHREHFTRAELLAPYREHVQYTAAVAVLLDMERCGEVVTNSAGQYALGPNFGFAF